MTLELQLSSDLEAQLRERAAAAGQDLAGFVLQAVAEKLGEAESRSLAQSCNEADWSHKLRDVIDLHPAVTQSVDDSRESIYAGRGE